MISFTQHFDADLESLLTEPEPFCLVRFGDGEVALIDGIAHQSADAWRTTGPSWLRGEIVASLRHDADGYCVGVPTPCCFASGLRIHPAIRVPRERRTFSTLFLHHNLSRVADVVERFRSALVVGSWFGDVRVPADGVTQRWDVDACVAELVKSKRDVLLAAGPCSNVIALRYWNLVPADERRTVIDVGSALDTFNGKNTRHFHSSMNDHVCSWQEPRRDRPRVEARTLRAPEPQQVIVQDDPAPQPAFQERGRHKGEPLSRHTKIGRRP